MILTDDQLKKVRQNRQVYENAESVSGVPWQALASVHYRECNFETDYSKIRTPGSFYQLDPIPSDPYLNKLLTSYTDLNAMSRLMLLKNGIKDFQSATIICAAYLRVKTPYKYSGQNTADHIIKDALYGYNGRAYGSADKSPYVMNMFDSAHENMRIVGSIPDGHGGRKHIDTVDKRPGAYTVYKFLREELK